MSLLNYIGSNLSNLSTTHEINSSACGTVLEGSVICVQPNIPECCYTPQDFSTYKIIILVYCYCIATFGVIVNSITIIALLHARRKCMNTFSPLKSSMTVLILNLSLSDLLVCLSYLPFISSEYLNGPWTFGPTLCYAWGFFRHVPTYTSFFSSAAIALDRCLALWCPKVKTMIFGRGRAVPAVIFLWMFTLALLIPLMIPSLKVGEFGYNYKMGSCDAVPNGTFFWHKIVVLIANFLPLSIMIISSVLIIIRVRKSWIEFSKMNSVAGHTLTQLQRRENKMTFTVICLVALNAVCITPISVQTLIGIHLGDALETILSILFWFNFVGNFFIYTYKSGCYHQAYKNLWLDILGLFGCKKYRNYANTSMVSSSTMTTTSNLSTTESSL